VIDIDCWTDPLGTGHHLAVQAEPAFTVRLAGLFAKDGIHLQLLQEEITAIRKQLDAAQYADSMESHGL
jgi:hypothetical protein